MADRVGQRLGNYHLTRLLGRGGFAEVYLGEHIYLNTQTAIKVLDTQLGDHLQQQFLREARTIARLIHPNIIRLLEFGVEQSAPFLVMDYAPHGTMRDRYPEGTRLTLPTVLPYLRQAALALQYAHGKRVIHRDIKPANLLLGEEDQILLSDFGIAVTFHSSLSQDQPSIAGTAAYMAPEQLGGQPHFASDQYALGIVVYEWLCGERPFRGSFTELAAQQVVASPPSLRAKVPTLSSGVEQVILRALAKDYQERFESVQAFIMALEQAAHPPRRSLSFTGALSLPGGLPESTPSSNLPTEPVTTYSPASSNLPTEPATTRKIHPITPAKNALAPGTTIAVFHAAAADVLALAWSPNGKHLAIAGSNGTVQIWDMKTGNTLLTYRGHSVPVLSLAWSPNGENIASAGPDQLIRIWNAFTGARVFSSRRLSEPISRLVWQRDGRRITAVSSNGTMKTWDAATGSDVITARSDHPGAGRGVPSPDGALLALITFDQAVEVRAGTGNRSLLTYRGHQGPVKVIAWSPEGKRIASGSADHAVHVWQVT